jgi:hypothetical protein
MSKKTAQQIIQEGNTVAEIGRIKEDIKRVSAWMIGVIVVLLIAFAAAFMAIGGMVVNSEAQNQATFQSLVNKIDALPTQAPVSGTAK